MAEIIRTDIRKDINKASFVAVEVDETTDVTQKAQISVIFRYVCEASYIVKEAFLGFDDVSQRGPTTSPRNNFAQVLSITSSGNLFFLENAKILGRNRNLGDRFQSKTFFFFFREHPDFGTKIGISEIDSN